MTAAEELTLIDAAMTAILTGGVASYSINGRSVTRLDYRFLVERKKELEIAIARQSSTGTCPVAKFRRTD